ncbi:DUF3572 domain-containing protein [Marivibrio halodurans]|uniref:DUF3572 domain-containing protein n=1 Tax=Marivibrio halodurans TaxID=2039722 RepID=A0A8J7RZA7_9PROT|nr:DUF3572 domain-containing protein [Marivibrio halodurans]MBP5857330.1 DUF3572 domain-containing protein [Marivibrio halodurans]
MNRDTAETIALQAMRFVAEDEDRLGRFLALSGIGPGELRERLGDPTFQMGLLDFLLNHEPDLLAFAEHAEIDPTQPAWARRTLARAAGLRDEESSI